MGVEHPVNAAELNRQAKRLDKQIADVEDRIRWEGQNLYVWRERDDRFEVRAHTATAAVVIGHGSNEGQVIRTAQRLDRYPDQIRDVVNRA